MTTTHELLLRARDALWTCHPGDYSTGHVIHPQYDEEKVEGVLAAIRDHLMSAPQQTPEAWGCFGPDGKLDPDLVGTKADCESWRDADDAENKWTVAPLYTSLHHLSAGEPAAPQAAAQAVAPQDFERMERTTPAELTRAALTELVRLKDEKTLAQLQADDDESVAMPATYRLAKNAAWAAARAAIATSPSPQQDDSASVVNQSLTTQTAQQAPSSTQAESDSVQVAAMWREFEETDEFKIARGWVKNDKPDTFSGVHGAMFTAFRAGLRRATPAAAPASEAPSGTVPLSWGSLSNTEVLQIAPMSGNFSQDEVEAFCAGFRRCAQAAHRP